ncbi:hypothetical protein GCM10025874_30630 [Arenivirga flava]|uniref:Uncharacterized protein n=1 Tax=Arenivirga flava TaxID=1930060 RepID=A0AA37UQC1_9MICO|nr:hypothetical protein GCM10025874_30630 [Arenivirga flava]
MRRPAPPADRARRQVDAQLLAVAELVPVLEQREHGPRGERGDLHHDDGARVGRGAVQQLTGDGRPGGVRIRSMPLEATEARGPAGHDQRADPRVPVAEQHGQVRHIAA